MIVDTNDHAADEQALADGLKAVEQCNADNGLIYVIDLNGHAADEQALADGLKAVWLMN